MDTCYNRSNRLVNADAMTAVGNCVANKIKYLAIKLERKTNRFGHYKIENANNIVLVSKTK